MSDFDPNDVESAIDNIRHLARAEEYRVSQHAHQEMVEEAISLEEILEAIESGEILENYPEHRRGPCCLVGGRTPLGRHLHLVCTTTSTTLIIITAYEPLMPKWLTPTQRNRPS